MNKKVKRFLSTLFNDLNAAYSEQNGRLEDLQLAIMDYDSRAELSFQDKGNLITIQDHAGEVEAFITDIEHAMKAIEALLGNQAAIPPYVGKLLEDYCRTCKEAAYTSKQELERGNVLSAEIKQLEHKLEAVGYAIFGGQETARNIELEKARRKAEKAERKHKDAQRNLQTVKGQCGIEDAESIPQKVIDPGSMAKPAADDDHICEMNCVGSTPQKDVGSNAQGDALAEAKENKADPAQSGGTPADAKENTANSAAQAEGIPADAKEDTADPTAQTGGTAANSKEAEEKSNEDVVLRVIIFI